MNNMQTGHEYKRLEKKKLSINELRKIQNDQSLYVINLSSIREGKGAMGGDINIPVRTANGETINVIIPKTYIPIDISHQAPREEIIRSNSFMAMINRGWIEAVNTEWAEKEYEKDEVREEYDLKVANRISNVPMEDITDKDIEDDAATNINAVAVSIVEREDIEEREKISIFRNNQNLFNVGDLNYIITKTDSDVIKQLAAEKIKTAK